MKNRHTKYNAMKQIKVTIEERRALQERFRVGDNYMMDVLAYRKNGPTAEKIRQAAIQMGGRFVDPDFAPNCRVQYIGGQIVQTFADQVVLTIDRESGDIILTHRGDVVDKVEKASMSMWTAMALQAQGIAEAAMVAR